MALTYGFCLGPENTMYTSAEFAEAFSRVFGDGVCDWGSVFEATAEGLQLTVGTGFGLTAGYWVKNDEPLTLTVPPAYNHADRTDFLVLQADLPARKARLTLIENADPADLPAEPHTVPLWQVYVKRGATNLLPGDLTDLRIQIPPLSSISADALRAYDFVTGGIDREVERILSLGQQVVDKGTAAIEQIDAVIESKNAGPGLGELQTAHDHPAPIAQWLLCDGSPVPETFPALSAILDGTLPHIDPIDPRFPTYIFAGEPQQEV